jgi:hypothetical protein
MSDSQCLHWVARSMGVVPCYKMGFIGNPIDAAVPVISGRGVCIPVHPDLITVCEMQFQHRFALLGTCYCGHEPEHRNVLLLQSGENFDRLVRILFCFVRMLLFLLIILANFCSTVHIFNASRRLRLIWNASRIYLQPCHLHLKPLHLPTFWYRGVG